MTETEYESYGEEVKQIYAMETLAFFNQERYPCFHVGGGLSSKKVLTSARDYLKKDPEYVLVMMCGSGGFEPIILEEFPNTIIHAVDLNPAGIKIAKGRNPDPKRIFYHLGNMIDIAKNPLEYFSKDVKFDLVVSEVALLYTPSDTRKEIFGGLKGFLNPDAVFSYTDWTNIALTNEDRDEVQRVWGGDIQRNHQIAQYHYEVKNMLMRMEVLNDRIFDWDLEYSEITGRPPIVDPDLWDGDSKEMWEFLSEDSVDYYKWLGKEYPKDEEEIMKLKLWIRDTYQELDYCSKKMMLYQLGVTLFTGYFFYP